MAVALTPGQAGDAPAFEPLWAAARSRLGRVREAVADRAYDSEAIRALLLAQGIRPQIADHPRRLRPVPLSRAAYRERNKVERLIGRLKQFRRVATRYDKLAATYLGFIHLALTVIRLG